MVCTNARVGLTIHINAQAGAPSRTSPQASHCLHQRVGLVHPSVLASGPVVTLRTSRLSTHASVSLEPAACSLLVLDQTLTTVGPCSGSGLLHVTAGFILQVASAPLSSFSTLMSTPARKDFECEMKAVFNCNIP